MWKYIISATIILISSQAFSQEGGDGIQLWRLGGAYLTCDDYVRVRSLGDYSIILFGAENVSLQTKRSLALLGDRLGSAKSVMAIETSNVAVCAQAISAIGCPPPDYDRLPAILVKTKNCHRCVWFDRLNRSMDVENALQKILSTIDDGYATSDLSWKSMVKNTLNSYFNKNQELAAWRDPSIFIVDIFPYRSLRELASPSEKCDR